MTHIPLWKIQMWRERQFREVRDAHVGMGVAIRALFGVCIANGVAVK